MYRQVLWNGYCRFSIPGLGLICPSWIFIRLKVRISHSFIVSNS